MLNGVIEGERMKDIEIKAILQEYENGLKKDGKTSKSIVSRKRDLKKALVLFNSRSEFDETVKSNASFSQLLKNLRNKYGTDKIYDIKNAISCYAKYAFNISIFTNHKVIKDALLNYSEAVAKFDEFGEFDTANIVGEYGEYYICKKFHLDRSFTNSKSIDATFAENGKEKGVQIKARWLRDGNLDSKSIEFGSIKPNEIDYFVGVIFDTNFDVVKLIVMSRDLIDLYFKKYSRSKKAIIYNKHFDESQFCLMELNQTKCR